MFKKISIGLLLGTLIIVGVFGTVLAQDNPPETPEEAGSSSPLRGGSFMLEPLAEAMGMTTSELLQVIQETLQELAAENGVDLEAFRLEQAAERVQQAVDDGRLTQEEADERIKQIQESMESGEWPVDGFGHPEGLPGPRYDGTALDELAAELGMSPAEMRQAVEAGQTPKELAEEKGIDLQSFMLEQFTERMQEVVDDGRLTQEEADERIEQFQEDLGSDDWRGNGSDFRNDKGGIDWGSQHGGSR